MTKYLTYAALIIALIALFYAAFDKEPVSEEELRRLESRARLYSLRAAMQVENITDYAESELESLNESVLESELLDSVQKRIQKTISAPRDLCEASGGEWREFPNACADKCNAGEVCAQVIVESCDCPDGCWTGSACRSET